MGEQKTMGTWEFCHIRCTILIRYGEKNYLSPFPRRAPLHSRVPSLECPIQHLPPNLPRDRTASVHRSIHRIHQPWSTFLFEAQRERGRINGTLIVWVSVYKSTEKVQACLLTIAIGRLAQQPATINHGNDNTYLHSAKPTNQWINSYGKIRDREFCLRILFVWQNNFRVWARNQSKSVNNSP